MTPATATALTEAIDHLYQCFSGYRDRLAKEPRPPEDQAVFDQLFSTELRQSRPEALLPLVRLLRLPTHRFGTLELKHLLPRLCEIALLAKPAIGFSTVTELLGLFDFEQWPTPERTAVWDYLLVFFRALLEEFSGRTSPPWGAYGFFSDLSRATEQMQPALLSWEMADFVTADLQLAKFAVTWAEDQPLRERQGWNRESIQTIERWLSTAGREKLSRASRTYADAPFREEFDAALATIA